jgi:hypothetical protein
MLVKCINEFDQSDFIINLPSGVCLVPGDGLTHGGDLFEIKRSHFNDDTGILEFGVKMLAKKDDGGIPRLNDDALPFAVYQEVIKLVRSGQKLQAVKCIKDNTGCSLKGAKDYVDQINLP